MPGPYRIDQAPAGRLSLLVGDKFPMQRGTTVAGSGFAQIEDINGALAAGGSNPLSVAGLSGLLVTPQTPAAHAASHAPGGTDPLAVDAAAATGSLRTIGTGALQACAGNDSRLSNSRAPTAHASSHQPGGTDALAVDAVAGTGSLRTLGTGAQQACGGADSRLSDARTPVAHASTHNAGGSDALAIDAAAATGSLRTIGSGALQACAGNDSRLSDARSPTAHAISHKSGGSDAIALDTLAAPTDITTLNVSTAAHGLAPKLPNDATKYLDGTGAYSAPPGAGGLVNPLAAGSLGAAAVQLVASGDGLYQPATNIVAIEANSFDVARFSSVASATDYWSFTNASGGTGDQLLMGAIGSNANIGFRIMAKGAGGGNKILQLDDGVVGWHFLGHSAGSPGALESDDQGTGGPSIQDKTSSATVPLYAFLGDLTTGLGRAGAGALSLTCAGTEVVRVTTSGLRFQVGNSTGAGAALLGANSPASTLTAPKTWISVVLADGTTAFIPAWQ